MFIPKEVKLVLKEFEKAGFESYLVGGCVRDFLLEKEPQDWDIATNAKPKEIEKLFPESFSNNKFGTVTILTKSQKPELKEIEITPYRIDEKYTDKRHPDEIKWAKTIEEDLARRDFTVNAMALKIQNSKFKNQNKSIKYKIIDPYEGQIDLEKKIIRAVREPKERFSEDALRIMRAARFAVTLDQEGNKGNQNKSYTKEDFDFEKGMTWEIEEKTARAIKENAPWLQAISKERIRDELMKIIMSERAAQGIELLRKLNLLKYIIPELEEGYKVAQNKHHIYDCYEHSLRSLDYAAKKGFNKYVRIAALLHDVGKPRVKEGEGEDATFYNHEVVGAKMTAQILDRLRFSKKDIEKISRLVRYHLFYYNVGEVSESSVRRLVRRVGIENMNELLQVRMADRIGSGVPKAEPYKLRHLRYIIEKVSRDPISVKRLEIKGGDVMKILKIEPGPKIGYVLDILLGYVLANPKKNNKEFLEKEIKKMGKLTDKELEELAQEARKEREEIEMKKDKMTKKKYWVS